MSDETDERARERMALQQVQKTARATSKQGLLLVVSVPVVDLVAALVITSGLSAILAIFTFLFAGVYTVATLVRGVAMIAAGSVRHHQASAQLETLEQNALPEARVISG